MKKPVGRPRINLIGQRFGRLVVLSDGERTKSNHPRWNCICDCGNETTVQSEHLRDHSTTSCGCFGREQIVKSRLTHGYTRVGKKVRLFSIWRTMVSRCTPGSSYPRLKDYADRGITICDEWLNYETFATWAIENGYSKDLTIDRIDNDGNYQPNNCRWATNKEQSRNRRSNRMVTINGTTKCLIEWCEDYNVKYTLAKDRLNRGWGNLETFETKPNQKRKEVKQ